MVQIIVLCIFVAILLVARKLFRASLKELIQPAIWIAWPWVLFVFSDMARGQVFEMEYRTSLTLLIILLFGLAVSKVFRARSIKTLQQYLGAVTWTDMALLLAFFAFAVRYLSIHSIGLFNVDPYSQTEFDTTSYRVLRHNLWLLGVDEYDPGLIKPMGTRWYIGGYLWLSSLYAKWAGISSPLVPNPYWYYYRVANLSTFVAAGAVLFSIYLAGKKIFSPLAGFFAALFFGVLMTFWEISFLLRDDIPVLAFSCLSLYFYLHYVEDGRKRFLGFAGLLGGLAISFRMTCLPILLAISLHYLWQMCRERRLSLRWWLRSSLPFLSLFAFPVVLSFFLSKPLRFLWPGLYAMGESYLKGYILWSEPIHGWVSSVAELPFHKRFSILAEVFYRLLDYNPLLLVLGIMALGYFIIIRRNAIITILTLSNLLFWIIMSNFGEVLWKRLPFYLFISAISFFLPLAGMLTDELGRGIKELKGRLSVSFLQWRVWMAVPFLVAVMVGFHHICFNRLLLDFEYMMKTDLRRTQTEILKTIPFGSSILINNSIDRVWGAVPNANIYENYGSDLDSLAPHYIAPLTDYFINANGYKGYKEYLDFSGEPVPATFSPSVWPDRDTYFKRRSSFYDSAWKAQQSGSPSIWRNRNSYFKRRSTIYDNLWKAQQAGNIELGEFSEEGELVQLWWSILWNGKLYRSLPLRTVTRRGRLGEKNDYQLVLSTSDIYKETLSRSPDLQPTGLKAFRKGFNYSVRIPSDNAYDSYFNQERNPEILSSLFPSSGDTRVKGLITLSSYPLAATLDLLKGADSGSFVKLTTGSDIHIDTVVYSNLIGVEPETAYRIEFVLRSRGIYTVVPEVHEHNAAGGALRTIYEPLHLSGDFKSFIIEYRTTAAAKEIDLGLFIQRITGELDIQGIRVWAKGSGRVFDVAQAAQVVPLDMIRDSGGLSLEYLIEDVPGKGLLNLEVVYESPEGLMISRRVYHLFGKGMKLWDNTRYLSGKTGEPVMINIPLWEDFRSNSPYTSLAYSAKIYLTAITPANEPLKVDFSQIRLEQ